MQCGVHRNVDDSTGEIPFLLDVQAGLKTRAVIPLVRRAAFGRPAGRLHPVFTIADGQVVMATHFLAAVRRRSLGAPIASLEDRRDVII